MSTNIIKLLLISFLLYSCSNNDDAFVQDIIQEDDTDQNDPNSDENTTPNNYTGKLIFVSANANGLENGTSWDNAYTDLQLAINNALKKDQIWVSKGTYTPKANGQRTISFILKDSVKLFGGFQGNETTLEQRDFISNQTILSGEIGDPNDVSDNLYHVIQNTTNFLTRESVIDGFVITRGNAGDPEPYERGGGIFNKNSSPTIRNCIFRDNYAQFGGGIYNLGESSPIIENCSFIENIATQGGGGVYNFLNSSPKIINCLIAGNHAKALYGGGIYNFQSSPIVINSCISGNKANKGGGIYNTNKSAPEFINATITGNLSLELGGGIYNFNSSSILKNTIIWNNLDVDLENNSPTTSIYNNQYSNYIASYCLIQNIFIANNNNIDGQGLYSSNIFNASLDPQLAPNIGGDFHLVSNSILIDRGNNIFNTTLYDLSGLNRIKNEIIDIGAYEY